jgi:hypothetical protein
MHAYSGRSWCSDGMLRANLARLTPNGPVAVAGCRTVAKMLSNHNMPVPATAAFTGLLASSWTTSRPARREGWPKRMRRPLVSRGAC